MEGLILLHYNPLDEPQVFVSYIGVFVKICASFGLINNTCRSAFLPLFVWDPQTVVYWMCLIGAVGLALVSFVLALLIFNDNIMFGFIGGVCGECVGFILLALFIMYAGNWNRQSGGIVNYFCTYVVLLAGVVAIAFDIEGSIYSAVVN